MLERKTLIAVLREHGKNYRVTRIDRDYATKKAYASDCRANGYYVCNILTVDEVKHIKHDFENRYRISLDDYNRLFKKYPVETLALLSDINVEELEETATETSADSEADIVEETELHGFHVNGVITETGMLMIACDIYAQDLDIKESYLAYNVGNGYAVYNEISLTRIGIYADSDAVKQFFVSRVKALEAETIKKLY